MTAEPPVTADHAGQTGGEREGDCGLCYVGQQCPGYCTIEGVGSLYDTPSRPAPVPGQAAREAAVEAVARWLFVRGFNMGLDWDETPPVLRDMMRDRVHELVRDHGADLAALSAAPGQGQP